MLFCNFNISRIGISHKEPTADWYIHFTTNNAKGDDDGKHYNYTFIDDTNDNYNESTFYYKDYQVYYYSNSPQIKYIIKSS